MAIDPPAVLGPQGMLKGGDQELLSGKDQAEHLNLCLYPCMKCHLDGAGQSFGAAGIGKCHWDELSNSSCSLVKQCSWPSLPRSNSFTFTFHNLCVYSSRKSCAIMSGVKGSPSTLQRVGICASARQIANNTVSLPSKEERGTRRQHHLGLSSGD